MLNRDKLIVVIIAVAVFIQCLVPSILGGLGIAVALFFLIRYAYNYDVPNEESIKKSKKDTNAYEWVTVKSDAIPKLFDFTGDCFRMNDARVTPGSFSSATISALIFGFLALGIAYYVLTPDDLTLTFGDINALMIFRLIGWYLIDCTIFKKYKVQYACVPDSDKDYIKFHQNKFTTITDLLDTNADIAGELTLAPQVEMRIKPPHEIEDIRLLVNPNTPISNLLCWMIPISMNRVQDQVFPYAYIVAVFKGHMSIENANAFNDDIEKCVQNNACEFQHTITKQDGNTVIVINLSGNAYFTDKPQLIQICNTIQNLQPIFNYHCNQFSND